MGGKGTEGKRGDAGSELAEFSQTDGDTKEIKVSLLFGVKNGFISI